MLWQSLAIEISLVPLEQLSAYTAVEYFLCFESPPPEDASPLQQVNRYLQAFGHLCEVEDWQRAIAILTVVPDRRTNEELHDQLGTWGYYDEQEKLYNSLLGKIDFRCDAVCCNGLGNIADSRGELDKATQYHQRHLELARQLGDRQGEWIALTGLGNAEKNRGRWQEAASYYRQGLDAIADGHDLANVFQARSMILGNLANVLRQHQPHQSLKLAKDVLEQFKQLGQPSLIARALVLVGDIYNGLEQPELALDYHQQGLDLAQSCHDPVSEIDALKGLGEVYFHLNEPQAGKVWYERCYKQAKLIGERSLEGQALRGLGMTAYELEDYEESRVYFQQYFKLTSSIGDRMGMLAAMQGLSYAFDAQGDLEAALLWEAMAVQLAEAMGEKAEAARSHAYLGYAYLNAQNYEMARTHLLSALAWQQKHGELAQLATTYCNLAKVYGYLGDLKKAWQCYRKGLKLAQQHKPSLMAAFQELRQNLSDDSRLYDYCGS